MNAEICINDISITCNLGNQRIEQGWYMSLRINYEQMKLKENVAVSESGFIFDPNSGESFSVNSTGKMILQMITKGLSMEEIESSITAEYDIDHKTFQRYMDDFAHSLRRLNLIETETDD